MGIDHSGRVAPRSGLPPSTGVVAAPGISLNQARPRRWIKRRAFVSHRRPYDRTPKRQRLGLVVRRTHAQVSDARR